MGLFGGTFNPVHLGHLRAAEEIREAFELAQVIFIPTNISPHKEGRDAVPAAYRMRMLELAIEGNPYFTISDVELRRTGKSYSIETINYFATTYGKELVPFFMVGLDAFLDIQSWKDYRELFSLCNFIVMSRPPYYINDPHKVIPEELKELFRYDSEEERFFTESGTSLYFKNITPLSISSQVVRMLVKEGRSIHYLVAKNVESYIREHGLYAGV